MENPALAPIRSKSKGRKPAAAWKSLPSEERFEAADGGAEGEEGESEEEDGDEGGDCPRGWRGGVGVRRAVEEVEAEDDAGGGGTEKEDEAEDADGGPGDLGALSHATVERVTRRFATHTNDARPVANS